DFDNCGSRSCGRNSNEVGRPCVAGPVDRGSRCGAYNAAMLESPNDALRIHHCPALDQATLVLALTGWMDGGDVSTGTVRRLVDLLDARPIAEIDPEPFYIYNVPGP